MPPEITTATSDFDYHLPPEQIALRPRRGSSRLMHLPPAGPVQHLAFPELPSLLLEGDLLVFNDTRVLKARLHGHRLNRDQSCGQSTMGGRVQALLVEPLGHQTERASHWLAMLRPGKRQRAGQRLVLGEIEATVLGRRDDLFELAFDAPLDSLMEALDAHGELPLPPYIQRATDASDEVDYQTVYAKTPGAVAAPTAGLHFNDQLFTALDDAGVERAMLTLHVGPGTFRPVQSDSPSEHLMDSERYRLSDNCVGAIAETKARGGRVVAVGTTVVRTLEGAARDGHLRAGEGRTDLFVLPGHHFHVVDGLITNFHLPRSTLLMLVAALAGRKRVLAAYEEAIRTNYRFYSYGDAMLVWPPPPAQPPPTPTKT